MEVHPRKRQPTNWQDATAGTISRIQQVFALHPLVLTDQGKTKSGLTEHSKIALYAQAHASVVAQGRANSNATEYWNTFVNVLRTLVAGMSDVDPAETFD